MSCVVYSPTLLRASFRSHSSHHWLSSAFIDVLLLNKCLSSHFRFSSDLLTNFLSDCIFDLLEFFLCSLSNNLFNLIFSHNICGLLDWNWLWKVDVKYDIEEDEADYSCNQDWRVLIPSKGTKSTYRVCNVREVLYHEGSIECHIIGIVCWSVSGTICKLHVDEIALRFKGFSKEVVHSSWVSPCKSEQEN